MICVEQREAERPLARAYHWTRRRNVWDIKNGNELGLIPRREIDYFDIQERKGRKLGPYIFALLGSPMPLEWKQNPVLYSSLLGRYGGEPQLISFDVYSSDDPQIADFGEYLKEGEVDIQDIQRYVDSIVPLAEYRGGYILPELLIPKRIPINRLNFLDGSKIVKRSVFF